MRPPGIGHSDPVGVEIDWATASVKDARLSVALSGDAPKGFGGQLEHVIARLATSGRRWGEVSAGKRKLHVDDVERGAEDDLRHFLESALLQANAAVGADADADGSESSDAGEPGPDEQMATAFRAFAER
jgi:hypothetical protein